MKTYRLTGTAQILFHLDIEAESEEDAQDQLEQEMNFQLDVNCFEVQCYELQSTEEV